MRTNAQQKNRICLLGASFDTGNLGISALAESSIKVILNRWPDAEIIILGSGYTPQQHCLSIRGKDISLGAFPIRFCKNIFLPYHFLWFVLYGFLTKVLPKSWIKKAVVNHNQYFRLLYETDLVVDITGGDSFSDIYGFRRFFLGFLRKWLIIFLHKKLVLLPQTYGPFTRPLSKRMAQYAMNHASLVYSRDPAGKQYVNRFLHHADNKKVRFAPDVAFVLDPRKPSDSDIAFLSGLSQKNVTLVGLNISGLLFNGGYTRDNMFDLKVDYRKLMREIINWLMETEHIVVVLIPHVFPAADSQVESDPIACLKVYEDTKEKYRNRLFLVQGKYNHNEIKYIIGKCDFLIGSRMHACIAAMSQYVPAAGIAYSKKFCGVFESIGLGSCVIDTRSSNEKQLLEKVETIFSCKDEIRKHLEDIIPRIKNDILNIFDNVAWIKSPMDTYDKSSTLSRESK